MATFHSFNGGAKIEDWKINMWIEECLDGLRWGKSNYSISSGDTSVIALQFDREIQIHVCNDSGRSVATITRDDDGLWQTPAKYERPVLQTTIVTVDPENNADHFWSELDTAFPGIASVLRKAGKAEVSQAEWIAIQKLPGFSDGPAYAKEALIEQV